MDRPIFDALVWKERALMSDPNNRLSQVLSHWMPRIQVSGITYSDATRVVENAGEWSNWCKAWSDEGSRQETIGDEMLKRQRYVSAGEAYIRSALFYHFGQFMFFDDLAQKQEAADKKVKVYQKAAPCLNPPAERLEIPYGDDSKLYGYFRRAPQTAPGNPIVIVVPGSDSTKEEFNSLESYFLQRGLSTFSFDGPGQGEGRSFGHLTPHWSEPIRAASALLQKREQEQCRLAIFGMAFGGHLVLQGSAGNPAIKAVVCMNGFYDLGGFWSELPEVYRANMGYTLGGGNLEETALHARGFSLRDVVRPSCPVLVMHGGKDRIFPPSEAELLKEYLGDAGELLLYPDGNHVCNNLPYIYRSEAADWLSEQLRDEG